VTAIEKTTAAPAGFGVTAREGRTLLASALIFVAAGFVPLVFDGYLLQVTISIVMYTAFATSWLLFSGPTNYIALSTAAFFGVGMYVTAAGIELVPYPVLILASGVAGAAMAAVVGLATLRVSGVYFVIFSLGLAELVRQFMTWGQPLCHHRTQRTDVLLAAFAADRGDFSGRLVDWPLAARICIADHRQ
jgi:ABC-type branched-subunit amino acid transport system permease subunit